MTEITSKEHQKQVQRFRRIYSAYEQNRDLISVGAYQQGGDARIDAAIELHPRMLEFLRQDMREPEQLDHSLAQLAALVGE